MLKVAVVDDEQESFELMCSLLKRYQEEAGTSFEISAFPSGVAFLAVDTADFDIVFMDIEMPYMNGLDTARALRKTNSTCVLIFVTNMAQYAIDGYEVDAMDYVIKPITWEALRFKMIRAIERAQQHRQGDLMLKTSDGLVRLDAADILYVEVMKHELHYHTAKGTFQTWGTLTAVEEQLTGHGFARCNVCYLVNLRHVDGIQGDYACVGGERLKISAPKRKEFLPALMRYMKGMK